MNNAPRNFDRCQVRRTTTIPMFMPRNNPDNTTMRYWTETHPGEGALGSYYQGFKESLECPKSPNGETVGEPAATKGTAFDALKALAVKTVCDNCRFSKLRPEEADRVVADEAEARARRLRAQTELRKAELEHAEVMRLGYEALRDIEQGPQLPPIQGE